MRCTIMQAENHMTMNGEGVVIPADKMPAGPVGLDGRPVRVIHFDGAVGTIERKSRAPGRVDFEHFIGEAPLQPYVDAFTVERDRLLELKRIQHEEAEQAAAESLRLATVAAEAAEAEQAASEAKATA